MIVHLPKSALASVPLIYDKQGKIDGALPQYYLSAGGPFRGVIIQSPCTREDRGQLSYGTVVMLVNQNWDGGSNYGWIGGIFFEN